MALLFRPIVITALLKFLRLRTTATPEPRHRTQGAEIAPLIWHHRRAPPCDADLVLSPAAQAWLSSLPSRVRPRHLADIFPRIVNRLALCWSDAALVDLVFEGLLVDQRGGRKGFPPDITAELVRLEAFHERRLYRSGGTATDKGRNAWTSHVQATADR